MIFLSNFHSEKMYSHLKQIRKYSYVPIKRPTFGDNARKPRNNKQEPKNINLSEQLRMRIKATGPISVAQYMNSVLTNPNSGYYMNRDVFGQHGDFITSPEIGQIFGEIVAIWICMEFRKIGAPQPVQLIELGPGRGTLMKDIIRVLSKLKMSQDLSVSLVEISPFMCQLQARQLCVNSKDTSDAYLNYHTGETISGIPINWYRTIEDVPRGFSIILAHEFFDALPAHKFQKSNGKWNEILIDVDDANDSAFRMVLSKNPTPFLNLFLQNMAKDEQRDHIEYSFEANQILDRLTARLEEDGGFGLIMDYGHLGDKSDTFRAFKNHQLHNPLIDPGSADLTVDVNFKEMKNILEKDKKLITFGPIEQREFFNKLGGEKRLKFLIENNSNTDDIEKLKSGYDMLTNPEQMGSRFKFLAMFPSVLRDHLMKFPVNGFS